MSSYKICKYCGKYEHDCNCKAAKEIRRLKLLLIELLAEVEGCYVGLMTHPTWSETPEGYLISVSSKTKLEVLKELVERNRKTLAKDLPQT